MSGGGHGGKHKGLINKPGPRLGHSVPLKFVQKGSHGKKSGYAELNLTSMVDMLTILVVFLLQTFSASGELLVVSKNIVLPEASNFKDLERAPVIGVSKDSVTLDGVPVADASELNKENTVDWKITDLHDRMVTLKNNYKLLHPTEDFKGSVIVQADKNVDFKVVKKIMYTCAVAGYSNVNFAVNEKSKGGGG
jgi:biopolymer transport protein ExbD